MGLPSGPTISPNIPIGIFIFIPIILALVTGTPLDEDEEDDEGEGRMISLTPAAIPAAVTNGAAVIAAAALIGNGIEGRSENVIG